MEEEYILVFKTSILKELGYFQGINLEVDRYLDAILDPANNIFKPRHEVENNPVFKQIIPYVLLRCGDLIFRYTRGKYLSEKRLEKKFSIGIGGHIRQEDENLFSIQTSIYDKTIEREVNEEVNIFTKYKNQRVGLINDDSNEVGKVHFGIVHIFDLEEPLVKKKETSITECKFIIPTQNLKRNFTKYETWSQLCIKELLLESRE